MSKIKNTEEFVKEIKRLEGHSYIYRGLADEKWKVEASLYRRIPKNIKPKNPQLYVGDVLKAAKLKAFDRSDGKQLFDLELLAKLQHIGAATCFIDFTEDPLVALWFACRDKKDKDGRVVVIDVDKVNNIKSINPNDLKDGIEKFLDGSKWYKWTPEQLGNRVVAQQSVFMFGQTAMQEENYDSIIIDGQSKDKIKEELKRSFSVSEGVLFNDLAGFAMCNSHAKVYQREDVERFLSSGLEFQRRKDYKGAISYYDMAIEINPKYGKAYRLRGCAKEESDEYADAIRDYDQAIRIDPKDVRAYRFRGFAKSMLGRNEEAIRDYSEAIKIDPKNAEAYYLRGLAKGILDRNKDAIKDFDKAIKIDPKNSTAYCGRGIAHGVLKGYADAIKDFSEALEIDPNNVQVRKYLDIAKNALKESEKDDKKYQR